MSTAIVNLEGTCILCLEEGLAPNEDCPNCQDELTLAEFRVEPYYDEFDMTGHWLRADARPEAIKRYLDRAYPGWTRYHLSVFPASIVESDSTSELSQEGKAIKAIYHSKAGVMALLQREDPATYDLIWDIVKNPELEA